MTDPGARRLDWKRRTSEIARETPGVERASILVPGPAKPRITSLVRRVSELASSLIGIQVPVYRLRVRVPCPPLDVNGCVVTS